MSGFFGHQKHLFKSQIDQLSGQLISFVVFFFVVIYFFVYFCQLIYFPNVCSSLGWVGPSQEQQAHWHEWQVPNHANHYLLLARACISRQLDSEAVLWLVGMGIPQKCYSNYSVKYLLQNKSF